MEGRWTIYVDQDNDLATGDDALDVGLTVRETPVVPCDDAAIERVMRVLDDGRVCPGDESDLTQAELRELATRALRAAGETP